MTIPRTRSSIPALVCFLFTVWAPIRLAAAQNLPVGDVMEDYARYLQLVEQIPSFSFNIRPLPIRDLYGELDAVAIHPWRNRMDFLRRMTHQKGLALSAFDPEVRLFWNSTRPFGMNDASVWQGRGATLALSSGAFLRIGPLSASLRPTILYNQNRAFEQWSESSFQHPTYSSIDMPERFGPDPFTTFDLGQSYIRLDYKGLAVGLSNENMWWGPALHNPIVMSNNAPGFPHLFLGTSGPQNIWIGQIQTRWIWGELTESDYFDENPDNDKRLITGIVLDFAPALIPGLSFGLTRIYTFYRPNTLTSDDFLLVFQAFLKKNTTQSNGGDQKDQILSAYLRWLVPESGLEIYGELGRGDHSEDFRDFFLEFEHGTGYTLGLQKAFVGPWDKDMRLSAEITRLQHPKTSLLRNPHPTGSYFYTHSGVRQGYTQLGQVIGAGIGPGSNSQIVALDLFESWGKAGLYARRTTLNADYFYYIQYPIVNAEDEMGVDITTGLNAYVFWGKYELGASLAFSQLLNQQFEHKRDASNLNATLTIRRTLVGPR